MQFIWTESDIICGRIICMPRTNPNSSLGWRAKWTYKIGYVGGSGSYAKAAGDLPASGICLIAMADGMVTHARSAKEMAEHLNKQGFIPCPHAYLLEIINFLRDSYETN
jgi:hypothetical protein